MQVPVLEVDARTGSRNCHLRRSVSVPDESGISAICRSVTALMSSALCRSVIVPHRIVNAPIGLLPYAVMAAPLSDGRASGIYQLIRIRDTTGYVLRWQSRRIRLTPSLLHTFQRDTVNSYKRKIMACLQLTERLLDCVVFSSSVNRIQTCI